MAPIKLHGDYVSQPVRAVALMLKANNIEFEFVSMPLMPIADRIFATDEYAATVNHLKEFRLLWWKEWQTFVRALQYLAGLEGVPDHWYPRSVKERILVNTYLAWHGPDVRKYAMGYFVASFVGPAFIDTPFTEDQVNEAREGFEALLDKLEKIWLKESHFLAGNDITIADLQCITELTQVGSTGYDMENGRPKLEAWMQRVKDTLKPYFDDICKVPLTFFENAFKKYKEAK